MKKLLCIVAAALVSAFSAEAAEKMKVQTSLGLRVGQYRSTTQLEVNSKNGMGIGLDLDLLRHRKYVSWGLGLRKRNADSPAGKVEYVGADILVGYYSNKNKEKLFGWHAMLGVGPGSLSGIGNGYSEIGPNPVHSELGLGLDWVVRTSKSKDPLRRPSAVTLSLDYIGDVFTRFFKRTDQAGKEVAAEMRTSGKMVTLGVNYFW